MSLALQTQKIAGNDSATFTFDSSIGAYVYAIQQLQLYTFGARFQRIGVSLAPQGGGVGANELTLAQTLHLDGVDLSRTWTEVTVLAWLGAENPPGIFMQNLNGIPVGSVSPRLATGGGAPLVAGAAIAGFDFSFAGDDSDLLGIGVSCGAVQDLFAGGTPAIRAVAQGTLLGSSSFTGAVDAALLALTAPQTGVAVDLVSISSLDATSQSQVGPYLGAQPIGSAGLLLQSFYGQFPIEEPETNMELVQFGSPADSIELNSDYLTYTGTQQLAGTCVGAGGHLLTVAATNLQTNSLLIALAG